MLQQSSSTSSTFGKCKSLEEKATGTVAPVSRNKISRWAPYITARSDGSASQSGTKPNDDKFLSVWEAANKLLVPVPSHAAPPVYRDPVKKSRPRAGKKLVKHPVRGKEDTEGSSISPKKKTRKDLHSNQIEEKEREEPTMENPS